LDQEELVHVCITSDENTIGGMIALVNSIDKNTKQPVMYHLVVDSGSLAHICTHQVSSTCSVNPHLIGEFHNGFS